MTNSLTQQHVLSYLLGKADTIKKPILSAKSPNRLGVKSGENLEFLCYLMQIRERRAEGEKG
jgi:hypothetical protein